MEIRPETPADYAAIATVNARAFEGRALEPSIVALHRQRAAFDPGLSLVAVDGGRVVGHILFSPRTIRLGGRAVRAVNLAPVAVEPEFQRKGVGGALIRAGHDSARERGYAVSFLLGHPEYYVRFGYRPRAFGVSSVPVLQGATTEALEERAVREGDLPALKALWLREEANVDFAIEPGEELLEWVSPNPAVKTTVYVRSGEVVGYTRVHPSEPSKPLLFLAADPDSARAVAMPFSALPLHPRSASSAAIGLPQTEACEAGMACELVPGALDVAELPGRPVWPVEFDLF